MKLVAEDRIFDRDFLSIIVDNLDLLHLDNFVGGYKLVTPVPEGRPEILGGLNPFSLIYGELFRGFNSSSLEYLLYMAMKLESLALLKH